jgi:Uma2 family endonuclease
MSTITQPNKAPAPPQPVPRDSVAPSGDQRIVIRGLSWDLYDLLSDAIGERQHVFLAYDGKDLEIMTTGRVHEDFKELLGWFIKVVTFELRVGCRGAGETTWKRPEIERGLEADLCYYFDPTKRAADAESRARKSRSVADYPNPDLAIEIDISPSQIDRRGIHSALEIAEFWRFDAASLAIEQLGPDGRYVLAESSRFLPVRADEVFRWVAQEDSNDEVAWELRLREWVRTKLAPRLEKK